MAAPRALVLGVFALLLVIAVANAEAASVVVGLAKCADCTRKNMKAEEAFKGKYAKLVPCQWRARVLFCICSSLLSLLPWTHLRC
jgi:hypothetical protein